MRNVSIEVQLASQSLSSYIYQFLGLLLAQRAVLEQVTLENILYVVHVHKH
jgi:hypothetical protein